MKEKIICAAIEEFSEKGLRFTMDDIAKRISISKKTLYKVFENKEDMMLAIADYCFKDIKESERIIVEDEGLDVVEKLKRLIIVLPKRYQNIGLCNLYQLNESYPRIYKRVAEYLENDWDATIMLLKEGMSEGRLKQLPIPIIKAMVEGTIQHFFSSSILVDNGISYEQGLQEMIHIIMEGITV